MDTGVDFGIEDLRSVLLLGSAVLLLAGCGAPSAGAPPAFCTAVPANGGAAEPTVTGNSSSPM